MVFRVVKKNIRLVALVALIVSISNTVFSADQCTALFQDRSAEIAIGELSEKLRVSPKIEDLAIVRITFSMSGTPIEVFVDYRDPSFSFHLAKILESQPKGIGSIVSTALRAVETNAPGRKREIPDFLHDLRIRRRMDKPLELSNMVNDSNLRALYTAILVKVAVKKLTKKDLEIVELISERSAQFALVSTGSKMEITRIDGVSRTKPASTLLSTETIRPLAIEVLRASPDPSFAQMIVPIQLAPNRIVDFEVLGRSPAEKIFKQEERAFEAAGENDLVVLEWLFHAAYAPLGHSSVRVGNTSIEFSFDGIRFHEGGTNSARAFLFNNPAFDSMIEQFGYKGGDPYSLGISMRLPKKVVLEFMRLARQYEGDFRLAVRNCNQVPCRLLSRSGFEIPNRWAYQDFSSVLTFNSLARSDEVEIAGYRIYPFNGVADRVGFRNYIAERLVQPNSAVAEIIEATVRMVRHEPKSSSK